MKKRYLIMLIIAIVLIICLGAGLAFMYFFTDIFKSNKQLFSKYFSQNSKAFEFFKDENINSYFEKQKNNTYTSEGTIKTNVTFPDSSQSVMANALQNCNITFNGKVDNQNKYFYETVKANYSDTQSIELNLYRNNDIYAAKMNDVLYKYVGIENNNLKELATKMNLPEEIISLIPNKIQLSTLSKNLNIFSDEDISTIKNKYINIITTNLTDDMFSKEKTSDETIYSLSLNETQLKNILVKILEELKDDEIIINGVKTKLINNYNLTEATINPYITQYKESIQRIIDTLSSNNISTNELSIDSSNTLNSMDRFTNTYLTQNMSEINLTIKVYSQNNKLVKTELNLNNTNSLVISKSDDGVKIQVFSNQNELASSYIQKIKSPTETKYEFVYSIDNNQLFDLTVGYSGLDTNSVHESSELNLDIGLNNSFISNSKTKFAITYQNTKTFVDIQKEEIPNSEILLLNTAPSKESIESLYKNIETKLIELNKTKLQTLGLTDDQNPFLYYIPSIVAVGSPYFIQNPDKVPYFSVPILLTGSSIAMLAGDNAVLSRAYEASNATAITTVREKIMLTVNQTLTDFYTEQQNNHNSTETPFSAVDKALKDFKSDDNNIEYTYSNKTITLKNKNNSKTITGTLSDDGSIKWNQ